MLFVPRQVSLAAAMPEKKTTATAKSAAAFDTASLVVCSIAAFLESHGFSRALAALQAEANLEDGSWRSSSPVSLEELFAKFLDSSNCAPGAGIAGNGEKENTANNGAEDSPKKKKKKGGAEVDETESKVSRPSSTEEPNGHGHAAEVPQDETKEKRKKKKKKDGVEAHEPESKASEPSALENTGEDANGETKEEKKKAGLSAGNAGNGQANGSINAGEDGKKKKGKKQEKDEDVGAEKHKKDRKNSAEETESCKESQSQNDAAEKNGLGEDAPQDKGKKKKKGKSTSEKPCSGISNEIDAANSADEARLEPHGAKEKSNAVEIGKVENEKKSKKKRKKSGSEENFMGEDKEISGKGSLAKSDHGNMSETEIAKAENRRPEGENAAVGKKRKLEEVEGSNTPTKEDGTTNQKLNNGFAEDDAKEKSIVSKPSKRQKHSSEPQTVNTFQRVKLEDVKFADERLQDNSYWAKGGADSGYGAKAQEVLGQVRGRDFRHEKTKKKRGSYRGGLIDLQTHSIKFNYSDDE